MVQAGRHSVDTDAAGNLTGDHFHSDHLNTPRIATNAARTKIWEWVSDAFGTKEARGQLEINLRFPGQYYDVETGLHYNYLRDYDPKTGRYMQSDPIGLDGGLNTYGYVEGNPISRFDVWGLQSAFPRVGDMSAVQFRTNLYNSELSKRNGNFDICDIQSFSDGRTTSICVVTGHGKIWLTKYYDTEQNRATTYDDNKNPQQPN